MVNIDDLLGRFKKPEPYSPERSKREVDEFKKKHAPELNRRYAQRKYTLRMENKNRVTSTGKPIPMPRYNRKPNIRGDELAEKKYRYKDIPKMERKRSDMPNRLSTKKSLKSPDSRPKNLNRYKKVRKAAQRRSRFISV